MNIFCIKNIVVLCCAGYFLSSSGQLVAQEKKSSDIRSISKYGAMQNAFNTQGPKAVKSIPEQKEPSEEDETWENIWSNMQTSFSIPWEDFLKKPEPGKSETDRISGNVSFTYPLSDIGLQEAGGSGSQGVVLGSPVIAASLSYVPLGYWFVGVNVMRYIFPDRQRSWNPDFTYSFGYNDWHPYTFSFTYSNYGGNRFIPDTSKHEAFTRFWEGNFSFGWKFPSAKLLEYLLVLHPSGGIGHNINVNIHPLYRDFRTQEVKMWKFSPSLSTKYTIYENIYFNFTLYWYPVPGQQQPWDPDFTYGIGFFDWHPFTLSIQYNNYVSGRFPWNPAPAGSVRSQGLLDGTLSASWSFTF